MIPGDAEDESGGMDGNPTMTTKPSGNLPTGSLGDSGPEDNGAARGNAQLILATIVPVLVVSWELYFM